jgi:hypothetical protein
MRWNEALELAARRLDTDTIRQLIADPEVTANGRRILETELSTRVDLPRQRQAPVQQASRTDTPSPPVSA